MNFPERKKQRRIDAVNRQVLYEARSSDEQLAELDNRFGKDLGAKKERAKLEGIVTIQRLKDKFKSSKKNKQSKKKKKEK
tara:strand:+ start:32171 stop:32410 length:240 start_codon:yes stop_codon:yes gene_type:complete